MSVEVHPASEQSTVSLLKGIILDSGDLIRQQLKFTQAEIRSDLRKTGEASKMLAIGGVVSLIGGVLLSLTLVHLLHWLTLPANAGEKAVGGLPLWGCYAIVGVAITATGLFLLKSGQNKLASNNIMPDQSAKQMKENLEWMTNSK